MVVCPARSRLVSGCCTGRSLGIGTTVLMDGRPRMMRHDQSGYGESRCLCSAPPSFFREGGPFGPPSLVSPCESCEFLWVSCPALQHHGGFRLPAGWRVTSA